MIERIKQLIEIKNDGLSESAFAEKMGMKQQTLNNYIRGINKLPLSFISSLLSTFPEISAEWLLRGDGPMSISDNLPVFRGDETEEEKELHVALAKCRGELKIAQEENIKLLGQLEFMEEYNLKVANKYNKVREELEKLQGKKTSGKKDII